jgi:hypothetical protein
VQVHNIKFGGIGSTNKEERDVRVMWKVGGRGEMHTRFWWGDRRERDHLKDAGEDGSIILK